MSLRENIKWLYRLTVGYRRKIFIPVILNIIGVCLSIGFVELTKILFDNICSSFNFVLALIVSLISVKIVQVICEESELLMRERVNAELENNITLRSFNSLLSSKISSVKSIHSGDGMNRLTTDIGVITQTLTYTLPTIIYASAQLVLTTLYLLWQQPKLTLCLIWIMPIMILLGNYYTRKILPITRNIRSEDTKINEYMQEHIQKHELVVSYSIKNIILNHIERLQGYLFKDIKKRTNYNILAETCIELGFSIGYLFIIIWGIIGIRDGNMTFALLLVFMQLLGQLQRPFIFFKTEIPSLINSFASIERLVEFDDLPKQLEGDDRHLDGKVGIKLDNVSFRYDDEENYIFEDMSLCITPGSRTALIGETGIGKTTLFKLILATYKPTKGDIIIFNHTQSFEIDDRTRCNFTYVPQGNTLISGTIRYNLLLGKPNATDSELRRALGMAAAEFVYSTLPDGLDTVVGENGVGLSEGQAQRIGIARGILYNKPIILLDEPTSALDSSTEKKLFDNIKKGLKNHTVIIISHKRDISKYVDRVINLNQQNGE